MVIVRFRLWLRLLLSKCSARSWKALTGFRWAPFPFGAILFIGSAILLKVGGLLFVADVR